MATFPYTIGESGTLGFPVFQYDGTPLPTDGLAVRLVVYLTGADLILPGTWESGTISTWARASMAACGAPSSRI